MIKVVGLTKKFKDENGEIIPVNNVNLIIKEGTFVSIIGRSGSGKSTLLKMLGGLLKPSDGEVLINNVSLYKMNDKELARYRSNKVGFVFQDFFLEDNFTVYQNIEIVLMLLKSPVIERKQKIKEVLKTVDLLEKENVLVKVLSGGEKQRVCIARAIISEPEIIYADEPCGNLDFENGQIIMKLLREQVNNGKHVILVTHNLEDANLTDEIFTLKDGRVINHEKKWYIKTCIPRI